MNNAVIDINEATIKNFVNTLRPPEKEIRKKLDIGYLYDGKIAEIFEIRQDWIDPTRYNNSSFAKMRYYKSKQKWSLYWMRASGKWELYNPFPESNHISEILEVIKKDENGCFFG